MPAATLRSLHDFGVCTASGRRGRIGGDLVAFAAAKRARGWGWQAIANCCRVNVLDLRAACGDPEAQAFLPPKPGAAKTPAPAHGRAPRRAEGLADGR